MQRNLARQETGSVCPEVIEAGKTKQPEAKKLDVLETWTDGQRVKLLNGAQVRARRISNREILDNVGLKVKVEDLEVASKVSDDPEIGEEEMQEQLEKGKVYASVAEALTQVFRNFPDQIYVFDEIGTAGIDTIKIGNVVDLHDSANFVVTENTGAKLHEQFESIGGSLLRTQFTTGRQGESITDGEDPLEKARFGFTVFFEQPVEGEDGKKETVELRFFYGRPDVEGVQDVENVVNVE